MLRSTVAFALLVAACGGSGAGGSGPAGEGGRGDAGGAAPGNGGDAATAVPSTGDAGTSIAPDAGSDAASAVTTIRIHYPAGAHTLSIRGSIAPLDWNAGVALTAGADDTWSITLPALAQAVEVKALLDDATWSRGPNYRVAPGASVDLYPHFTTVKGTYARAYDFASAILGTTRGIWIYTPPSYAENTRARFPVVYMHDGQNLFDGSTAFGGNEWKIDETMDAAAEDGTIAEAVVIGVENTSARIDEYTPVADPTDGGGQGASYLQMLVQELKPRVDGEMRTLADRDHTAMMGSSLGGLFSAYAGVERGDVYGAVAALSPSTWWDGTWLIGEVAAVSQKAARATRVYVDSGDSGTSNDDVTNTAALAAQYRAVGYVDGVTLSYRVQAGASHSEVYWAARAPGALAFVLGPGR